MRVVAVQMWLAREDGRTVCRRIAPADKRSRGRPGQTSRPWPWAAGGCVVAWCSCMMLPDCIEEKYNMPDEEKVCHATGATCSVW